jgi:hypothetical protein
MKDSLVHVVLAQIGPHISLGYFWAYVQPPRRSIVLSAETAFGQPLDLPGEVTPETEASTELSTPSWLLLFLQPRASLAPMQRLLPSLWFWVSSRPS